MLKEGKTLLGDDLEQFIRYYHSYSYNVDWAARFKETFPNFAHRNLVRFHLGGEFDGKTDLKLCKASSKLMKEGILFFPIYPFVDVENDTRRPLLYYPFDSRINEYWGDRNFSNFPGIKHIFFKIVGVDIIKASNNNNNDLIHSYY
jgi:hypothetical protein